MHHFIHENIKQIRQHAGKSNLVVVSKYRSIQELEKVYETNQQDFAENRVQELLKKKEMMPSDIRWHMIGHLQTNKVKLIAPFIHLIQSVDSLKLLREINKQGKIYNRVIPILFQIHIAQEEDKYGLSEEELRKLIQSTEIESFKNITVKGLMGMATNTHIESHIEAEFLKLSDLYNEYKDQLHWEILSMGMSGDFHIAIKCGSNLIRVGSKIFNSPL